MPSTRSSARIAANNSSSPPKSSPQSTKKTGGNKRKADSSPAQNKSKRGRKGAEKDQKTLEETLQPENGEEQEQEQEQETEQDFDKDQPTDIEMKEAASAGEGAEAKPDKREEAKTDKNNGAAEHQSNDKGPDFKPGATFEGENKQGEGKDDAEKALKDSRDGKGFNTMEDKGPSYDNAPADEFHESEAAGSNRHDAHKQGVETKEGNEVKENTSENTGGAVEESKERAEAQPSNILEKGIIYFFTRGRVGIEDPEDIQDIQRSYFVLRPLPQGAKLGDGAIEDSKINRLIALPKKVWPKSHRDRFMAFVESAKTSMDDLKGSFFQGSEYSTKTTGVRQAPPVTPVGEGVYAITSTGRSESHLAYMLTIPREPGEIQEDMGIRAKGSFVLSLKNPTVKGPAYASLPEGPDFPQEFIDEFNSRGWMPAQPKHLDYPNAQVLLIGESFEDSKALEPSHKDEKAENKETPLEEMEKLEHEDELRVEHLKGDDTVFDDLHISSKEYPSVATTW